MSFTRSLGLAVPLLALGLAGCSVSAPETPQNTPRPSSSFETPTPSVSASVSPTPSPTPTPSPGITEQAAGLVAELETSEQAALLVMAGVPATGASKAQIQSLADAGLSSVFLRGRSQLSVKQTRAKVDQITDGLATNLPQKLPIWVATDQEGGYVRVLQGPGFSDLPTALTQGQWSENRLADSIHEAGDELAQAGININLAPVADTVPQRLAASNAPIGYWKRNYAFDPQSVSEAVQSVNAALYEAGIQPVVKHFPGLGRVKSNTDTSANVVDSVTTVQDEYLLPFEDAITQDVAWVMISNARYAEIDAENLAPFSKTVITDLLRTELGYQRLVISDDLCDAVAVSEIEVGHRAVQFIAAGGTVALCVRSEPAVQMVRALTQEAEVDPGFATKIEQAATVVITERLRQVQ